MEEKITARLGRGILKLAALQNRVYSAFDTTIPSAVSMQLYGGGYVCSNASPSCSTGTYNLTIFNGETHTLNPVQALLQRNSGSNNRDGMISYETPIGSMYAGTSLMQSYYNNVFDSSGVYPAFDYTFSSVSPSAISQTTREFRLFFGGNPSEKTTLDLSMYVVNSQYHVPDPNYCAAIYTPGADVHYSDTSYTYAAPRVGFVWRPSPAIAVRAAAGGGLAQAPLSAMIGSNIPIFFGPGYESAPPNFNLQPEKSVAFDLGTDFRLPRNTLLSFDVFRADLHGQLYSYQSVDGTYSGPEGTLPLFVQQYVNLSSSRYEGLLLDLRRDAPRGLSWSVAGALTRGYVISVAPGFYNALGATCDFSTGNNCVNLSVVPGANFNGTYNAGVGGYGGGASVPYAQAHGGIEYTWNTGRSAGLSATYFGNNNSYFRPAFVEVDGNYPLTKNISLGVAFQNITGIYDGSMQSFNPANFSSVQTIAGLPYALYGQEFGPRTVQLLLRVSL
jgi:hypothetical protein